MRSDCVKISTDFKIDMRVIFSAMNSERLWKVSIVFVFNVPKLHAKQPEDGGRVSDDEIETMVSEIFERF